MELLRVDRQLLQWRRYYQVTLMKANNQQFSVGMDDMLETDKTFQYYWATFHNSVFVIACKLQLRDHTYYTMIHFSQNYPQRHLQISKGTPVFDRSVWNGCLDSMIIKKSSCSPHLQLIAAMAGPCLSKFKTYLPLNLACSVWELIDLTTLLKTCHYQSEYM